MIKEIREYFLSSPILDELSKINVDFLGTDPQEYTIDGQVFDPVVKKYVDGGALKQYVFAFGSREYYGADTIQNIENSGFYERISSWIEEQNNIGNLPILTGNKEAKSIEVLTSGYLFDSSEDNARYQIQMRLTYYEDK